MQIIGKKIRLIAGYVPASTSFTQVLLNPNGILFSCLQATVQAWQPMHFFRSITIPYLTFFELAALAVSPSNLAGLVRVTNPNPKAVRPATFRNSLRLNLLLFNSSIFIYHPFYAINFSLVIIITVNTVTNLYKKTPYIG